MTDTVEGVALTLSETVAATGRSLSTIKRKRDAGEFPNAYQDGTGAWRIPVQDLSAAGLRISAPSQPDPPRPVTEVSSALAQVADPGQLEELAEARAAIARLTTELAVAHAQRDAMADHLDDLRLAVRAIAGRPPEPASAPAATPVSVPAAVQPRRSWRDAFRRAG